MELDSYFKKHLGDGASINKTDGFFIGDNRSICQIHGRPIRHHSDRFDTPKGLLPNGWEVIDNQHSRLSGKHLVSESTAKKLGTLFDQVEKLKSEIKDLLTNEPEPPPPLPPKH